MYRKLDVSRTLLGHVKLRLIIASKHHCAIIRVHIKFYLKKKIRIFLFQCLGFRKRLLCVIREQLWSFVIK